MTETGWKKLLAKVEILPKRAKVVPVGERFLLAFEKELGLKLPASYKAYCQVFGAGQIANQFNIAVPGFPGKRSTYSVQYLSKSQAELADQYAALGVDGAQCKRGIYFCLDILGSNHFFDPEVVTNTKKSEFAVYSLFRNCEVQSTADSFEQFVTDFCLGDRHNELIQTDDPPEMVFRPIGK